MLSKNNIKFVQGLCQKKTSALHQLFIIEGDKIISELLSQNSYKLHTLYYTATWAATQIFTHIPNNYIQISEGEMVQLTNMQSAPNVLAVVHYNAPTALPNANDELILCLYNLQDPGNLGSIIRTANWFGIKHIVCTSNTVNAYNFKVVQASMGSILRLTVHYTSVDKYILSHAGVPIYAATLQGVNYTTVPKCKKGILVIGNEGNGLPIELITNCTEQISIPKIGNAESLNASVATGILLAHFCS